MKQQQLSNNDWQLLSEYLDGQISPRDRASLEKRMQTQVELRDGLEELRKTRTLLRTVNKQRAPRNFTLTPSMVEQARPRPWLRLIPVLNLASAASALAVIMVMAVSLLPGITPAAAPAPVEAPASMEVDSFSQTAPEGTPPMIIQWGGGAYGLGGAGGAPIGGGLESAPSAAQAAPLADLAPSEKAMPSQATQTPPGMGILEAPAANAARSEIAQAPLEGSGPILGVVPPQEAQADNQRELQKPSLQTSQQTPEQSAAEEQNWVIPALLLGVIAIATALASYLLRRKSAV